MYFKNVKLHLLKKAYCLYNRLQKKHQNQKGYKKLHVLWIARCQTCQIVCKKFRSDCLRLSGMFEIMLVNCWSCLYVAKLLAKNSSGV